VSVDVANTGASEGDEVVQLYARFPGSKVDRPRNKLVGFARITVKAGETRRVEIPLRGRDLAYWEATRRAWALEKGKVELLAGSSSADAALTLRTTIDAGS
jgi:beta-glucosidase